MRKALHLYLLLVASPTFCFGQFEDRTEEIDSLGVLISTVSPSQGSGISFFDFNHDGWDDLTVGRKSPTDSIFSDLVCFVNNQGSFTHANFNIPSGSEGTISSIIWVDYNNDGASDIFISRKNGRLELWQNDGEFNFENVASQAGLPVDIKRYRGCSFADFDHDGLLDLFITTDYGTNQIHHNLLFKNNGDNTFINVTESSGVLLSSRATLQSSFVDVNNDNWEDIFLAVDRTAFPNELFINNQDGTFERVTFSNGVDTYMDGMSTTSGDINNDGYLDLYVTNLPGELGNVLYLNNGDGSFYNAALDFGVVLNLASYGAMFLDYDNNGLEDLIVGTVSEGSGLAFFENIGSEFVANEDFIIPENPSLDTYVLAMGDMNNDGFYDFIGHNSWPQQLSLFKNIGGANSYMSISLEGTIANRDGIGSWIHCYVDSMKYSRYTTCGENFLAQNSSKEIFGLGELESVDSLVVEWNSGTVDRYTDLQINTHHHLIEGASLSEPFDIAHSDDLFLCSGEFVELDAGAFASYAWNTGDTTKIITVSEPGTYSVEVVNEFGLSVQSIPVTVEAAPETETIISTTDISCSGADDGIINVNLAGAAINSILWNTGALSSEISDLEQGVYAFSGLDEYGCPFSGEVSIAEPAPLLVLTNVTDVLCYGGTTGVVALDVINGTPPYNINWEEVDPAAVSAGNYAVVVTDTNGCEIELPFFVQQPDSLQLNLTIQDAANGNENGSAELEVSGGTPPYGVNWSTGETAEFLIEELAPGNYTLTVTDYNGCSEEMEFTISTNTAFRESHVDKPLLFPNPNNGRFRISNCPSQLFDLVVIDNLGKQVASRSDIQCGNEVKFGHLKPGSYLLQLTSMDTQQYFRLMIVN